MARSLSSGAHSRLFIVAERRLGIKAIPAPVRKVDANPSKKRIVTLPHPAP
jgi:hypothetical protein